MCHAAGGYTKHCIVPETTKSKTQTGSSKVVCIDPASGERLHQVIVPVSAVTACTFGGDDLATLYITVKVPKA